jgi:hypothetical protein
VLAPEPRRVRPALAGNALRSSAAPQQEARPERRRYPVERKQVLHLSWPLTEGPPQKVYSGGPTGALPCSSTSRSNMRDLESFRGGGASMGLREGDRRGGPDLVQLTVQQADATLASDDEPATYL